MKALKLSVLAMALFAVSACGSQQSTSSQATSAPTSEPTSAPTSAPINKSFTLSKNYSFVEGAKTIDLKPMIQLGENTTLADLEFSCINDNVTFDNGVATATAYGFHSISISVKGLLNSAKDFSAIMGPLNFAHATYQGVTPTGRNDDMEYTYEGGSTVTLALNESTFQLTTTAGKILKSGEQVDVPASSFSGTFTCDVANGLFFLTNNEAGWDKLKGNFFDYTSEGRGFEFHIGGFPNGGTTTKLTIVTDN